MMLSEMVQARGIVEGGSITCGGGGRLKPSSMVRMLVMTLSNHASKGAVCSSICHLTLAIGSSAYSRRHPKKGRRGCWGRLFPQN